METITREEIGKILEKEYETTDDDEHIAYFYFIFKARNGDSFKKTVSEVFNKDGITYHKLVDDMSVESPSGESMFVYFIKYVKTVNERNREKRLESISTTIKDKIDTPTTVMITRACKYTPLERDIN